MLRDSTLPPAQLSDMAKKYFSDAYAEGHFKGARYMGILYEEGLGVTKDPKTAAMWYQKAADTNFDVMSVSL